tara:strand:- start:12128 stop:14476 length:2349 start_codon:yes stop_codon:yes gene_type:complete
VPAAKLDAINELADLDPKTNKVVTPRIQSLSTAVGLYYNVLRDDGPSSRQRGKVDAMFDGAPPYDQSKLLAAGQGGRCNLNFGDAQRLLDAAQAGYVDLLSSIEYLVDVHTTNSEEGDLGQIEADSIVNDELTSLIRDWPEFSSRFLTLSNQFLKHGVGATYFENESNWRFAVAGLSDFKFPRGVRANEEAMDIAFTRRDYAVHELLEFIKHPKIAAAHGWNIKSVHQAIFNATRSDKKSLGSGDWEAFQAQVKNLEFNQALRNKSTRVVHVWVKEGGGQVSHYMFEEKLAGLQTGDTAPAKKPTLKGQDFMYKHHNRFTRTQEAFTLFTYGVGNNGTYHSVRGMGQRIFPHIQTLNRLSCQMVDAAAVSGGVMLQPNSMEDLRDLALQSFGPYNIISPNIEVIKQQSTPNLTQNMVPVANDMRRQLEDTSDFYSTSQATKGSPYRNTLQVQAELQSATRLSAANLSLFYGALDRLLRVVVERIVNSPSSDAQVKDFFRRCEARGISREQVKSIDHRRTRAVRAIGAGNPAARVSALDALDRERQFYDEEGNRNLSFDKTAALLGDHRSARRYVTPTNQPRGTVDESNATLENAIISIGGEVHALPAHLHGTHIKVHLGPAQELIQAITGRQVDPIDVLDRIEGTAIHINEHAQLLAPDPTQKDIVAQALDTTNKLGQIIQNTQKSLEAQGGGAEGEGEVEGGGGGGEDAQAAAQAAAADEQAKLRVAQVDEKIKMAAAETDMAIKKAKAEQDQRLKDFAAAQDAMRREQRDTLKGPQLLSE